MSDSNQLIDVGLINTDLDNKTDDKSGNCCFYLSNYLNNCLLCCFICLN